MCERDFRVPPEGIRRRVPTPAGTNPGADCSCLGCWGEAKFDCCWRTCRAAADLIKNNKGVNNKEARVKHSLRSDTCYRNRFNYGKLVRFLSLIKFSYVNSQSKIKNFLFF